MVIAFYVWTSASAGSPFEFSGNHGGYYDLLTHGFLSGHVYLKLEPPPELLALPNPFDPVANARYRVNDLSLYRGKYYLYFGPVPVLTLCLPWHALTGNTLPEDFAALIFVTAGYIFSLLLLDILLKAAGVRPPPILKAAAAVALGMGQYGAVVVRDPGVYGVAVAAGFCFFMAGMFCFARWFSSDRPNGWLGALAGLLIGLTPGCRPHYALAALALCLLSLASMKAPRRQAIWFILPVALCGLLVLWYNSARFGNPLEFGTTYQLTAVAATRGVSLRLGNLPRGLYYLLLFPPGLGEQFPFLAPRYVGPTPGFYVENQVGLLALCPLAIAGLTLPRLRQPIIAGLWTCAVVLLVFISLTGFAVGRYLLDFAPALLVISMVAWLSVATQSGRVWMRRGAAIALVCGALWSATLAAALSLGFNDFMLRHKPHLYRTLALASGMPAARIRLPVDGLSMTGAVRFPQSPVMVREGLLRTGRLGAQDCLFIEYAGPNSLRFGYVKSAVGTELSPPVTIVPGRDYRLDVWYSATSQRLVVSLDGQGPWSVPAWFYPTSIDEIVPRQGPTGVADVRPFSGWLRLPPTAGVVYTAGSRETFGYNRN